jgi:hypothetical protein
MYLFFNPLRKDDDFNFIIYNLIIIFKYFNFFIHFLSPLKFDFSNHFYYNL